MPTVNGRVEILEEDEELALFKLAARGKQMAEKAARQLTMFRVKVHRNLTRDEENKLRQKVTEGKQMWRQTQTTVIGAFEPFVKNRVKWFRRHRSIVRRERDDLLPEARRGLVVAFARFDYTRGTRFVSCAWWWVDHYISRHIDTTRTTVSGCLTDIRIHRRATEKAKKKNRTHTPTSEQVTEMMGKEATKRPFIEEAIGECFVPGSRMQRKLHRQFEEDDFSDCAYSKDKQEDPAAEAQARDFLDRAIASLLPWEALITMLRNGIECQEEKLAALASEALGTPFTPESFASKLSDAVTKAQKKHNKTNNKKVHRDGKYTIRELAEFFGQNEMWVRKFEKAAKGKLRRVFWAHRTQS